MDPENYHWSYHWFSILLPLTDLAIRLGLSVRVIMKKRSYGVSFAWLIVIMLLPLFGALLYLFFGEKRVGETRAKRANRALHHYHRWLATLHNENPIDWQSMNPGCELIERQADAIIGIPSLSGNNLELIENPEEILKAIINDINKSISTCHLQFYIWHPGGIADEVGMALIKAAKRGVTCRVLVDSIGSKKFLAGSLVHKMRQAGIKVVESLPAGLFRALFVRIDLRNHRKIVIIDGKIAYTGSQNMVDPKFFKQNEGVGQWIDIMARIQGPVVETLAGTFVSDWHLDTEDTEEISRSLMEDSEDLRKTADVFPSPPVGPVPVQLVPSGPDFTRGAIHDLLLTTIYTARHELILTTPYFVPDESLLTALKSAAQRGVEVTIIIPEKNDSRLVHYASKAHFESLSEAGVKILLFQNGLLHSKTITVDNDFSLFGSVNLDMRSFWLNFEATLFIYNREFTDQLRETQMKYAAASRTVDISCMRKRPAVQKFMENSALLLGPLL